MASASRKRGRGTGDNDQPRPATAAPAPDRVTLQVGTETFVTSNIRSEYVRHVILRSKSTLVT